MPRRLGRVHLLDTPDAFIDENDLGPDALALDVDAFADRLAGRHGLIKSALMDQSLVAGLGNLYTDEVLFQAGLHPRTPVAALDDEARRALFEALQDVLTIAIACQADPEQLPADRFLLPHRQGDKKDPYSGADLKTVTVAGRTGYYSPVRQPGPEDPR
jgi:formamidopyrimidine-DNA glycosylase